MISRPVERRRKRSPARVRIGEWGAGWVHRGAPRLVASGVRVFVCRRRVACAPLDGAVARA